MFNLFNLIIGGITLLIPMDRAWKTEINKKIQTLNETLGHLD